MQREAEVRAGKAVGSGLSTTFTPMSDKPPVGLRPRWLVLSDRADEIQAAIKRYDEQALICPDQWLIELRDIEHQLAILAPRPEPESVDAEFTPPAAEIPEPIRTGAAPFYVVVASDDSGAGSGGNPITWETQIPEGSSLRAVLQHQSRVGHRYGTTFIAECRIIPELTRDV